MKVAPLHPKEVERLRALEALNILDSVVEEAYDDLAALASTICGTPIALVSFIDEERQWFKAHLGLEVRETSRDIAVCSHAILQKELFVIEDTKQDERFVDNPLVVSAPHMRFYAGMPIYSNELPLGTLCVLDTKPRTLTEEQRTSLKRLARQVEQLFALRVQVKELEREASHKNDFISMVNHELRTPLTSILGGITLLNSGRFGEFAAPAQKLMHIAHRNSTRLLHIINEILDVAALRDGQFQHLPKPFDLIKSAKQNLDLIRSFAEENGAPITFVTSLESAPVCADPNRIAQVFQNLLSNAVKYSAQNTPISVSLHEDGAMYCLTVANKGPGIPLDEQPRLFQRFFKTKVEHKGSPKGAGLGLYISKNIMELSQGRIGYSSVPDKDTSFWFTLPQHKPDKPI